MGAVVQTMLVLHGPVRLQHVAPGTHGLVGLFLCCVRGVAGASRGGC